MPTVWLRMSQDDRSVSNTLPYVASRDHAHEHLAAIRSLADEPFDIEKYELSPQQTQVLIRYLGGLPLSQAAEVSGVPLHTARSWCMSSKKFQMAMRESASHLAVTARAMLDVAAVTAIELAVEVIGAPGEATKDRLTAAEMILRRATAFHRNDLDDAFRNLVEGMKAAAAAGEAKR